MSIEVIKEEIQKFSFKAKEIEANVLKQKQQLEEDAKAFDQFIESSDAQAQDAVSLADRQTKLRLEKSRDLNQLQQQLQIVEREIFMHQETLEDYCCYRAFIEELTPADWTNEQQAAKKERQQERRKRRIEKRKEAWRMEQTTKLKEEREREEAAALAKSGRSSRIARRRTKTKATTAASGATITDEADACSNSIQLPPSPRFEDDSLTDSDEELPMYFERPQQLEDVFTTLEDETLLLMTSNQDDHFQAGLDGDAIARGRKQFTDKSREIEQTMQQLHKSIEREREKAKEFERQAQKNSIIDRARQDNELLQSLNKKVRQVYRTCGVNASDSSSTLVMLEQIEAEFETLLGNIAKLPKKHLVQAEESKQKKRREMIRLQKKAEQERMNEEKRRKAMERAMEPPKKRVGKPIMYRSRLVSKEGEGRKCEPDADELDEIRHLN